jgi:hypothetical protein
MPAKRMEVASRASRHVTMVAWACTSPDAPFWPKLPADKRREVGGTAEAGAPVVGGAVLERKQYTGLAVTEGDKAAKACE